MPVLRIVRMGHPVLRQPALPVARPIDPDIARLVDDMIETMRHAGGVGLAAPQVGVALRLVIFSVPQARADEPQAPEGSSRGPVPLTVLINPEIEPQDDSMEEQWEACLSVPGLTGRVPRHRRILYRGLSLDGAPVERLAEGFHARVVQHECDHLDGILYPQRMVDMTTLMFVDEVSGSRAVVEERA